MGPRIRLIVNAIPMVNVNTGIGRYMRCLYTELERSYGDRLEIGYFDGLKVTRRMPAGPANLGRWTKGVDLFWDVPAYPALMARLAFHFLREGIFKKWSRGFDVYHEAGFFPFSVSPRLKTLFTVCDLSLIRFPQYHPRERVLFSRLFFERRTRMVGHFLTISDFVAKEMQDVLKIDKKSISVTYLAHNKSVFYPRADEAIRQFLNLYSLPQKYFLFVGTGDPRKNMDVIPRAIKQGGLDVPVAVAGWSGWSGEGDAEGVVPLGFVSDDDLARAYSGAVAMVFPSSYEGFGLPVLEAMACGCPVVTTREASLPEVAGDAAWYMKDPRDVDDLADILTRLITRPEMRQDLKEKGLQKAHRFSWEMTADKTFGAFEAVLA